MEHYSDNQNFRRLCIYIQWSKSKESFLTKHQIGLFWSSRFHNKIGLDYEKLVKIEGFKIKVDQNSNSNYLDLKDLWKLTIKAPRIGKNQILDHFFKDCLVLKYYCFVEDFCVSWWYKGQTRPK